jgi:hypothetical protein
LATCHVTRGCCNNHTAFYKPDQIVDGPWIVTAVRHGHDDYRGCRFQDAGLDRCRGSTRRFIYHRLESGIFGSNISYDAHSQVVFIVDDYQTFEWKGDTFGYS